MFLLLDMLVAEWEPTPCYRDAYSVGIPKGACGEKSGQIHCKTTVSPVANVFFWLVNGLFIFSGRWWYGCFISVRLGHPGPDRRSFIPGELSIEFANIGGWLTYGDLALLSSWL